MRLELRWEYRKMILVNTEASTVLAMGWFLKS